MLPTVPAFTWLRNYNKDDAVADLIAGVVVTVLLIPQSLAYALLAGVPPEVGLYASILPLFIYALMGSSRSLSVGPVAVISLMTASALGNISNPEAYLQGAITLALLSGGMLMALGLLRAGFVANFLSHTVISGFISASGVLIALSQLKHLLGVSSHGDTLPELLHSLVGQIGGFNGVTLMTGALVIAFLVWTRNHLKPLLMRFGLSATPAGHVAKAGPIFAVLLSVLAAYALGFDQRGVALVGDIPAGLPSLSFPMPSLELAKALFVPALMITVIGYVESVSVGKTLAAKRRLRIEPNQELVALGAANITSAISGAFPVTGGFSRSVVNFDAGARTQMASVFAAIGIAMASLWLTPALYYLPAATLAATIVVAVLSLIDIDMLKHTWRYSRGDFAAVVMTIVITLLAGVEAGVASGVLLTIGLFMYRSSRPHVAEVGLIEGTEHFRNIKRHEVSTCPGVVTLRPDESLYFANASFLEELIYARVSESESLRHVVLMCSAINDIDYSALEMLEAVNERLSEQGVSLHMSEVKGPVMDRLKRSGFLDALSGKIYLSQYECFSDLLAECDPA